jgi:sRNA-binding carbon storage regulator CsrA
MPNPTIVTASLDDKELRDSITKLVTDYKDNLEKMKTATTQAVNEMTQTIKSLGNIKIDMTGTLDGLEKAKKKLSGGTTSGTTSGTASAAAPDTIGALKEEIRLQQKKVDEQVRGTVEAQYEVNVHRELQRQLKEETKSELAKREARAKRDLKDATTLPMNDLQQAQYRLRELTKVAANWQ